MINLKDHSLRNIEIIFSGDIIDEEAQLVPSLYQNFHKSWDYRSHHSSSNPLVTTDSGINEDSEEETRIFESTEFSSLERWLNTIGLDQYHCGLTQHGCTSLEQLHQLNSRWVRS